MSQNGSNAAKVRHYYGEVLEGSGGLRTSACCANAAPPPHLRELIRDIEPEVLERFYGCGAPVPEEIEGCTVLDLGCGTGRDAFLASKLVGRRGRVIGVDMTPEQLDIAQRCLPRQMARYGYARPNVEFKLGRIENLDALGIEDESIDVVISDCVINLSADKPRVFDEIFRVLKPGGELHFSDVFADRRLPEALRNDPILLGECLAGAMYEEDFRRRLGELGCPDYRRVTSTPITIEDRELEARIGMARFESLTIRAFKLGSLEDRCEDYGQLATYLGTVAHAPHRFALDEGHVFETGKPERVCGNTAAMLEDTRLAKHFNVAGDRSVHFGLFDCGEARQANTAPGACC